MADLIQQVEQQVQISEHQIWLKDSETDWDGEWENDDDCYNTGIAVAKDVIGLVTFTQAFGEVPFILEMWDAPPLADDINDYHTVGEASINISNGRLAIEGIDHKSEVPVTSGKYRLRIYYADEDTCTYDGGTAANHVRIVLYPHSMEGLKFLKIGETENEPSRKYHGNRTEEELTFMLKSRIISYQCLAVVALLRLGKLQTIYGALEGGSTSMKRVAISALWLGGPNSLSMLSIQANSTDPNIRLRVVCALELLNRKV